MMDTLDFIASVVSSLARPIILVGLVVVMKQPISAPLSGDLKRWRAGANGSDFQPEWLHESRNDK